MPTKRKTTKKKSTRTSKKTTRKSAPRRTGTNRLRTTKARGTRSRRESGMPGGGAGRREEASGSGVYPASGPPPPANAPYQGMASWGQGERGATGYEDSGRSEPSTLGSEKDLYGQAGPRDRVRQTKEDESREAEPSQPQNQPESRQTREEKTPRESEKPGESRRSKRQWESPQHGMQR